MGETRRRAKNGKETACKTTGYKCREKYYEKNLSLYGMQYYQ
jgi:hypothetical protein